MKYKITVVVPIPKTDQNQGHKHWRSASSSRKKDREAAQKASMIAVEELGDYEAYEFPWARARVLVTWYHPRKQFRDMWNMVGCLKGTLDGIVRSGILEDDDLIQPPAIRRRVDKEDPRVEITLYRLGDPDD